MTGQNARRDDIESAYHAACEVLKDARTFLDAGSLVDRLTPETRWAPAADGLRRSFPGSEKIIRGVLRALAAATQGLGIVTCGHLSAPTAHEMVLKLGQHALDLLDITPAFSDRRKYERILSQCQIGQPADVREELEKLKLRPLCESNLDRLSQIRPDLHARIAELRKHDGPPTSADHEAVVHLTQSTGVPPLREWDMLKVRLKREYTDTMESLGISLGISDTSNDQRASTSKGVSLQNAASRVRLNDPDGQAKLVKSWQDSRTPKLPPPIGKDPEHAQRNLYEPAAILAFLKIFEGETVDQDFRLSAYFRHVSRYPRSQQSPL